jgi:hypothetical protein
MTHDHVGSNLVRPDQWANPARGGGGDAGGSDGLEARLAKLESDVSHINSDLGEIKQDIREIKGDARADFRLLFGALITVALGLAGLIAHGFKWL